MAARTPQMIEADRRLGLRIRQARLSAGLSQRMLGAAVLKSLGAIQHYEYGDHTCSPSMLFEIARVLRKPVSWFYEDQQQGASHGQEREGERPREREGEERQGQGPAPKAA